MNSRSLITKEQAEAAIDLFEQGIGYAAASTKLDVHKPSLKALHDRWLVRGTMALMERHRRTRLSRETKIEIAKRYLSGEHKIALAKEYDLNSSQPIRAWAREYRDHGDEAFITPPSTTRGKTARLRAVDNGEDPDAQRHESKPDLMAKKTHVDDISLAEYRQLQDRLLRAEAENAYLKKLRALGHKRQP